MSLPTYISRITSLSPVSFWPLQETTGTTATDAIGAHHGTYVGGYAQAQSGPTADSVGVLFNGSTAEIDISNSAIIPGNATFTLECWARQGGGPLVSNGTLIGITNSGNNTPILSLCYNNNGNGYAGAYQLAMRSGPNGFTGTLGVGDISDGNWHHVVALFDTSVGANGSILIYLDGTNVYTGNPGATPIQTQTFDRTTLGAAKRTSTGLQYNGYMSLAAVYNYALTPTQIAANYAELTKSGLTSVPRFSFTKVSDTPTSFGEVF